MNMIKTSLSLMLVFMFSFTVSVDAQQIHRCGQDKALEQLYAQDPGAEAQFEATRNSILEYLSTNKDNLKISEDENTYYIPVVVHMVYSNETQNLSDEQINSQIAVLNEDFNRLNPDSTNTRADFTAIAGSANVQFVLAQVDPEGNPTTGIVRTETTEISFDSGDTPYGWDNVKREEEGGSDAWPRNSYMNMWVCNLDPGFGVLGYAYPPGGVAWQDGIVLAYRYFGRIGSNFPYDLGRTTTHEVGHWLGLSHMWGFGGCSSDDGVSDTPISTTSYFGCPSAAASSCSSLDNWENYMDYVDDRCMNMFTDGQIELMRGILNDSIGVRKNLQTSEGIYQTTGLFGPEKTRFEVTLYPNPANSETVTVDFGAALTESANIHVYDQVGRQVYGAAIGAGQNRFSVDISRLSAGLYSLRVEGETAVATSKLVISQ
ncbi:MAG: hypothetical protein ACI959_001431 [Limisphaerales bacterium]|jgi:hypothetical protein